MAMKTKFTPPNATELGERSKALKLEVADLQSRAEVKAQAPNLLLEALELIEGYEQAFIYTQKAINKDPDIDYSAGQQKH